MPYGTCPCPEITSTAIVDNVPTPTTCPETSDVDDTGGGTYVATCPDGHVHAFDTRYLPNVTET